MDTIKIVCDSVATCMNSVANGGQPMVKVAETNCADVQIVLIICGTIVLVSLIAFAFIGYYIRSHYASHEKMYASTNTYTEIARLREEIEKLKTKKVEQTEPEKTESEKAKDLLSYIVGEAKNKEGSFCQEKVLALFELYKKIKEEYADKANNGQE